ncbi:hypothetical protein K439DRAFT_98046 [Ramaria rubella]|nr:hypothetical protein K439DRAFT_98046 [Ramaria rubella]
MSAAKKSLNSRKKPAASSHPPFADMIKECITAHPSEARAGVSRPTIKKFLETKYGLDISAGTVTNINRAIAHGAEKGLFTLPKGPSGKVKLTPKARSDAGKEVRLMVQNQCCHPKFGPCSRMQPPLLPLLSRKLPRNLRLPKRTKLLLKQLVRPPYLHLRAPRNLR